MKKILLILLLICTSLNFYAQVQINCDPSAVINKINSIVTNYPEIAGAGGDKLGGFGFNNTSVRYLGTPTDTCFIVKAPDSCGIGENCRVLCCISSGIINYTVLCPNADSGDFVPHDFTIFNYGGLTLTHTINGNVLSIRGELGQSNHGSADIYCNSCVESVINNYLEDLNDPNNSGGTNCNNFNCEIERTPLPGLSPPSCALYARISGCNGTLSIVGWKSRKLGSTGPFSPMVGGSGQNCPTDGQAFGISGGAYEFCFEAKCYKAYGVVCTTQCCDTVCMNIVNLNKSFGTSMVLNNKDDIQVFPNPIEKFMKFSYFSEKNKVADITILNILGQKVKVYRKEIIKGNSTSEIDLTGIPSGNYFVKFNISGDITDRQITIK